MNDMAERLGTPQQTIFHNRIVLSPIIVAISFPDNKCRMKRTVLLHKIDTECFVIGPRMPLENSKIRSICTDGDTEPRSVSQDRFPKRRIQPTRVKQPFPASDNR